MAKSLNRAQLIGNLTRDPELKYTPSGRPVCSFGIATNRSWTNDAGERKDEVDFHNIVAWGKLAEICGQYLAKGRKTYVEGRLATRSWTGQDGAQKSRTEIVIDDMILLDGRRGEEDNSEGASTKPYKAANTQKAEKKKSNEVESKIEEGGEGGQDEISPDDIPF